ncbi:hypothetical protein [Streptomyces wuyuanensis]|uniref:hypothetical protein n=1 Tax=Streptomyces wuyuanensis TaxID=1196353 RepID=UPI00371ED1A5
MYSVINMDGLAPADRFSFWWEAVARSVVPVHASSEDVLGFWAEMTAVDLGRVQIFRVRCLSFEARRTPRLIRRADPGLLQLSLTLLWLTGHPRGTGGEPARTTALPRHDLTAAHGGCAFGGGAASESGELSGVPAGPPA